ncbi:nuclear transport factor 2 family protein [Mucilaginibacter boryungensis]|uniref:Nuclear transport factor 2 family protein n=1 Tax=Mucilaginibacter boryungensis TaxID=768480 RepID=A0ABR9XFV1_9SPHI|nr:nuclear transport factor 2 family protein [Mucilaginibacter boryungensis]MBE9666276.1 nuclear transport factor 2 family protein [Mucilaginibacter boryungensis]
MKKLPVLIFACLLFTVSAFAQTKDEKDVAAAVEFMRKAMVDGDRANLTKLAADDLSYGHSSGKIQDKKEFVEAIASGASDFVTIDLTDQTIKVAGNTAIVRHKLSAQTNDGGKPGSTVLGIMLVFQKQKGAWKLLARQAYKLPVQ